jgi:hypothetical protein
MIKLPCTSGIRITAGEALDESGVMSCFHNNMYHTRSVYIEFPVNESPMDMQDAGA